MRWIKDEEFIRGNLPMTKYETRILTIGLLEIEKGDKFLDIGSGTGSISIEAALQGAKTFSLEREDEGIRLIEANRKRFSVEDLRVLHKEAPEGIEEFDTTFDKCFIGGSGGKLKDIMSALDKCLREEAIVVANFITLKNLIEFQSLLEQYEYEDIETRLIQSSQVDSRSGMILSNNPIFIVKGVKS